jgi:hypothetical protein
MKRRWKVLPLALLALLAFGVVAANASAAKAPRWKVAGAFLGSETKNLVGTSSGTIKLKGGELELTSTGCTVVGKIEGTGTGVAGKNKEIKLKCTGVVVGGGFSEVCKARSSGQAAGSQIVETNALKSTLVYLKKETTSGVESVGDLFEPEAGPTAVFVTIIVEGKECPLAGEYAVKGQTVGKFKQAGESEFEEGELEFPTTRIESYFVNGEATTSTAVSSLTLGKVGSTASKATFSGLFKVHLEPKQKIGVFPG